MAQQNIKQIKGSTQGSILFLGPNGVVSENSQNLNWNQTLNTLNIQGAFSVDGSASTTQTLIVGGNLIIGDSTFADNSSFAAGQLSTADGFASVALGLNSQAGATYSFAAGVEVIASKEGQFAIGTYNTDNNEEDIFVIGNGTGNLDRSDLAKFGTNSIVFNAGLKTDYLDFATTSVESQERRLYWDEVNKTISLGLSGNLNLQIGQEQYYLVANNTGATLSSGKIVGAVGVSASGDTINAGYYLADGSTSAQFVLGIVTEDIANGDKGYVTEFGLVRGIDTTGSEYSESWLEGDLLYASPTFSGGLTKIKPVAPNLSILTAIVISATSSGSIFVRPTFNGRLDDLDNVEFYGVTPSQDDILQYSATSSLWIRREYNYGAYSAGIISGATSWSNTSPSSGQIRLPNVDVCLYDNSNFQGNLYKFSVTGATTGTGSLAEIVDNDTNYVYIDYNSGNPIWVVNQDNTLINYSSTVPYVQVYRTGNITHVVEFGNIGSGLVEKMNQRDITLNLFQIESGVALGLSGSSGIVTVSEGVVWEGPYRISLLSLNSLSNAFYKNYHVSGQWTYSTSFDYLNNTFYDDLTDLVTASASKYLVNWYYRGVHAARHLFEVYGNAQYDTFSEAELAGEPSIPELVSSHGVLIGRVIVQVGTYSAVAQNVSNTTFQSSVVTSHNDLNGLQGGLSNQYFHLSDSQYLNNAYINVDNQFTVNQTVNGYELKTETWTESNILISTTNSVIGSGFTFNDNATSSTNLWSAQKTFDYSNRETIDGNKTFSGEILIQGTLSTNGIVSTEVTNTGVITTSDLIVTNFATFSQIKSTFSYFGPSSTASTAWVDIEGSNTSYASLRLRSGVEPTSPNDGDIYYDGTHSYIRNNSIWRQLDNNPDNPNTITVAKEGGQFTSIKAAVESIVDATASNVYTVSVGGGVYYEEPFTIPSYVAVVGESSISTIIEATFSNQTLINLLDQSGIFDVQIQGCTGASVSAVIYQSSTTPQAQAIAYVENVRFGTNYTHVKVIADGGANIIVQCSNVKYGGYVFTEGFVATNTGSGVGRMQLRNVTSTNGGITSTTGLIFARAIAPNCGFIVQGCLLTKAAGAAQGTGFLIENGGFLRLTSVNFQRWSKGIYAPADGGTPNIDAVGLNFENNTIDVQIDNPNTIGKVAGTDNYSKTIISPTASLYVVGKDAKRIIVAKKGGDFSSISAAVNSITDSSESNRYVVEVGAGIFIENEIDLSTRPYVSVVGANIQTTQVYASASNQNLFKMGLFNEISFLSLNDVGTGFAGIMVDDSGDFSQAHKLSFYNCDIGIKVLSSTQDTLFYGEYVDFNGTYSQGVCVDAQGSNFVAFANIENAYFFPGVTGSLGVCVYDENAEANVTVATFEGFGEDTAFYLENGGALKVTSTDVVGYETGLCVPNIGTASTFNFNAVTMDDTISVPLKIEQPNTVGFFQGSIYNHTTIQNSSEDVYWSFLDQFDGELNITRKSSVTFADGTTTDLTTLVFEASPMGVLSGGLLTQVSGLTISVSSGYGYLETNAAVYKRIDWPTQEFLLNDNKSEYIFINENDNLKTSGSLPDIEKYIVLGRAVTDNGTILFIDNTRVDIKHSDNKLNLFNRKAIGAIYESGSLVTSATAFSLNVSQGSYWFGESNFTPVGGSTISFSQFYEDGSGGWIITTTNSVTSQYDAGSGSLITMSSSYYTKHTLYVVGESLDERYLMVVGQNQYLNLVDAEDAPLPTPPSYFEDGVASIASIYVREGLDSILQIEDIRPVLGFKASGVNATSDHGNLLGLSDDDHPQYLLVDGSRSMVGNLQMGSNSISGVNQVNGVIVENHSDRHLPNGADPLTTGIPSTIGTTNQEGTANAFARQDHIHAHGNQAGGTLHATASQTTAGFMSAEDKVIFDAIPSTYVNVSGDTMTGVLTMSVNKITEVATGSNNLDAVNYGQLIKTGAFDNFIYVSEKEDFGASVSGVYTLIPDKTYWITEVVDLGGGRIVAASNSTILGGSSENCRIKSTGLTSGVPLITSSYSIILRGLTIEANTALNLNPGTTSTNQAIDWFGVNFSDCPQVGTISNYSNFIASDCAWLNSSELAFDGTFGTIGFSQCLLTGQAGKRIIIIPPTATITRRFRAIYSSFVAFGGATALEVSPTASIPNEGYILDTINFSGGSTYVSGVDASSNKALFINCVGITNSSVVGSYYVQNGAIATSVTLDTWAVATASTTGILNSKFEHGGNRLTYTGVRSLTFKVTAVASISWTGGGNNKDIGIGIVKNGDTTLVTSEITTRATTSGTPYNVSSQEVFSLSTNDFVEIYVITRSATVTNITIESLHVIITGT